MTTTVSMTVDCEDAVKSVRLWPPEEGVRRLMIIFPEMELRVAKQIINNEADLVNHPNGGADLVMRATP